MLSRIVNVHHVDFVGFTKGDIDYRDPEEGHVDDMMHDKLKVVQF